MRKTALAAAFALLSCAAHAQSPSPAASPSPTSSPSPAPSPEAAGVRERVLERLDRLGVDKRALDALLADERPLTRAGEPVVGDERKSALFDWRRVLDRRIAVAQLDAERVTLEARRLEKPPRGGEAELEKLKDELATIRARAEKGARVIAAVQLERDAASQALQTLRAKGRGGPASAPASGTTTEAQMLALLGSTRALPSAHLETLEMEVAARPRHQKSLEGLAAMLSETVEPAAARPVSEAEVASREQKRQEAAQEAARQQTQAEATIRRAENQERAAETAQKKAAEEAAHATSAEDRDTAAIHARIAERTKQSAEALKYLGQLRGDVAATQLARTEKDLEHYRWLHRLASEPPAAPELSKALREARPVAPGLRTRLQSALARLSQVNEERLALERQKTGAEKSGRGRGRAATAAAQEAKAIDEVLATLREQSVALDRAIENLRATVDAASRLEAQLERVLGEEGLLVRRKPTLESGPIAGLLADFGWAWQYPSRAWRPVSDWFAGVRRAFAEDASGAIVLPLVLSWLVGIAAAVFGTRFLRQLSRHAAQSYGPSSATVLSVASAGLLWVPVILPVLLGLVLIPAQDRGFAILLSWLGTWSASHMVLRLARKWFLVPRIDPAAPPREPSPAPAWVELAMPSAPSSDLAAAERAACASLWRTLFPLAVLSSTLLPAYLSMRLTLYRPELAAQVWLVYELLLAALLFRAVRLRAELVQIRRGAGIARRASILVVASLRVLVLALLPPVPLVEAFGYGGLARFLVTRAGLTVLVGHVVRLVFEAVLELWKPDTRDVPEAEVDEGEPDAGAQEGLGELIASMLSFLLVVGTAFALFFIWGGTWESWGRLLAIAGRHVSLVGIELSLRGIVEASLVLWFARWVARVNDWVLERRVFPRIELDSGMRYAVAQTARYCIFAVGLFWALDAIGVGLEGLKWFAGFAGIGVGFGMQNIIQNFISGLIVLYERPVRVGDVVEVKGVFGIIKRISVRSTLVRQTSNIDVFVPNSSLLSENVVNWTLRGQRVRLEIPIALPAASDPVHARDVMLAAAAAEPAVLKRPAPTVVCEKVASGVLDFVLLVWVKTPLRVREIRSNLLFAVLAELRRAGFSGAAPAEPPSPAAPSGSPA
jgi:small-conductance mechanosensitive channel